MVSNAKKQRIIELIGKEKYSFQPEIISWMVKCSVKDVMTVWEEMAESEFAEVQP